MATQIFSLIHLGSLCNVRVKMLLQSVINIAMGSAIVLFFCDLMAPKF